MTQIADLTDRLNRLAKRREDEGIYTDAMIASSAAICIAALEARLAEAKAEIERLREVIKPFADEANNWDGFEDEEHLVESFPGLPETSRLQVFHLRAALKAAMEAGQ